MTVTFGHSELIVLDWKAYMSSLGVWKLDGERGSLTAVATLHHGNKMPAAVNEAL